MNQVLQEPIYDERVNQTLTGLAEGKNREELAQQFGYSTWKSLDIYLRRKGFRWIPEKQNYMPILSTTELLIRERPSVVPLRAAQVLSLFDRDKVDPRSIAEEMGFSDHREMATYMEDNGLRWSPEKKNYILTEGPLTKTHPFVPGHTKENSDSGSIRSFLPLLDLLDKNKDRLLNMLMTTSDGAIPRYCVPGPPKTKSIYMSDPLANVLNAFSDAKKISQREIVETAIVEYLKRYGFEEEINTLLK